MKSQLLVAQSNDNVRRCCLSHPEIGFDKIILNLPDFVHEVEGLRVGRVYITLMVMEHGLNTNILDILERNFVRMSINSIDAWRVIG